ncbi:creatininase family protein [Saccharothrix sp. NPDC042600]|uniref:creatininase family protein n=1 Tax=Saccharothrix TaxID=2071 RepID=UPI0033F1EE5F|nr:creatininase family protein [Saccharothrix mutabilis subsp. capreolus]
MITLATTEDVRARGAAVAVLPVGSFEQHGPHLPLATDTLIACAIARGLADAYPVQLLPPITISCSHEHADWPGTVSISARTLHSVIMDVAESLPGLPLVIVNAHGGNYVLSNVVQESRRMALYPTSADWAEARAAAGVETPSATDMHAGEIETSILLHVHPEVVRPGFETADHVADDRRHLLTTGMAAYTSSGVVGRPSRASADKGRDLLAALVGGFARHLATL